MRQLSVFAIQAVLAGTLVACAESQVTDDDTVSPESSLPSSRPSNPIQVNDGSLSVTGAQAIVAAESTDRDTPIIIIPDVGAANPDSGSDGNDESPSNPFAPVPDAEPDTVEPDTTDSNDSNDSNDNGSDGGSVDSDTDSPVAEEPDSGTDTVSPGQDASDGGDSGSESPNGASPDEAPAALPDPSPDPSPGDSGGSSGSGSDGGSSLKSKSHTTPGFEGEVIDGAIRVTWAVDPLARGYNVYRQAQYITTVMTNEYLDTDVFDRDYYYEIQAFDYDDKLYYVATGLTVSPTTLGKTDPNEPIADANRLDDYELVFADEFNGMTLDGSKWNTAYLWGPNLVINSEEQYYVDILRNPDFGYNPFTFDGEHLTINSIETPPELAHKSLNQPYLSGVITSYDAFKFTYGYAETRAKVTYGRGYWPAFWLLNAYYGGDDPEIDIMEFIGDDQDVVYHTYHYYDAEGNLRSTKSKPTPGIDYSADFHTFAVEWKPGTIIYLVDGIEVHRVTDPKVSSEEMYVIANTALGGWWAGSPDAATPFPGEYTLDYIRVYQRITPFDDFLLDDGMTNVPFADDIPGQSSPSHRPSPEQWPEGYPYRAR